MTGATSAPTWRAARATWRSAWREARADRRGFWLGIAIMIANDVVWIVFWLLFFNRVGEIRGWGIDEVIVLFATLTAGAGLVLGLFNNARRIGDLASSGALDATLSLPTSPLVHVLCRRIQTINLGDLAFGILLFVAFGQPNIERTLVFMLGVLCAALTITGFVLTLGSLAFWSRGRGDVADLGFQALILFSSYPADFFGGPLRIVLLSVVPATFVSSVPAKLVSEFNPGWALAMVGVAVVSALIGWMTFTLGLRRYTSGASWVAA